MAQGQPAEGRDRAGPTPGPWRAETVRHSDSVWLVGPDDGAIAYLATVRDPDVDLKNAELIVRAVNNFDDLVAVCSEILTGLDRITPMGKWRQIDEWKDKARAVLARAEGRT